MSKPADQLTRDEMLDMLARFIAQRPGLEPANYYGAPQAYRSDYRGILRDKHDAEELLRNVRWRQSISAEDIRKALQTGGRLTLSEDGRLSYCTGQYFPVEYRAAACRVLSDLLWAYWREGRDSADAIRKHASAELGRGLANRWFW